jgi:ABC-type dipeptide/oligopeptide/nickel transport system permease subunit
VSVLHERKFSAGIKSWPPPLTIVYFWDDPVRNLQMPLGPALVMGGALGAVMARITRSSTIEVLGEDYDRTARAKGVREPLTTRVVRSMMLSIKELSYVEAARVVGASGPRVIARHIAPQCVAPFLVITTGHLGAAIFIEAALSFVGVGVPPPTPNWGNMLGGSWPRRSSRRGGMVVFPASRSRSRSSR